MKAAQRDSKALRSALYYAKREMRVFPVQPDGKVQCHRLVDSWKEEATTNPEKIREWWSELPEANVAVATGEWEGRGTFFAVDIDPPEGYDTWEKRREEHPDEAPEPTLSVQTPSGGSHLYYTAPPGVKIKSAANLLGEGVDIKGNGGYVVAPPSSTDTGDYSFWGGTVEEIAEAPFWLISEAYKAGPEPETTRPRPSDRPDPGLVEEALQAIPPHPDYDTWIRIIAAVKDGVTSNQEAARILERWSPEDRNGDYTYAERVRNAPDEQITVGTLFHLAREHGWTPPWERNGHSSPEKKSRETAESAPPTVQPLLGTEEPDPMEWRVADFVPEGFLTMLVGDGGTGKSILALYLSLCICTGRSFLGMGTRKGTVLYVDHELDLDEQLRRVHRIGRGMGLDAGDEDLRDRFLYWRPQNPLGSEEHQEALLEAVDTHGIDLVILDSLTMGAEGDVTDVADVVPIMQHIRRWPTTVAIDHVSHNTAKRSAAQARAFGSVFKRNAARSSLTLAQSDTGGYCIQQEKSNFSDGEGRLVYAVEWGTEEITFESISDADERAAGLLSDLSSKDVTLVAVKEEYDALEGAVLAENVVQWRDERDEVSSVQRKTVQNHFSALKRRGDLIGADGEGVKPKKAEYRPEDNAPF